MQIVPDNKLIGDIVNMKTTQQKHLRGVMQKEQKGDKMTKGFAESMAGFFNDVNNIEVKSNDLSTQMAIDPESVNLHDVMIAAEQAEMAVAFSKSVVDKIISAYKEMTRLR